MGGKSSKGREEQARKLLSWGLRDFTTVHLFSAGQSLGEEPVWYGENHRLPVGSVQEQSLSLPKRSGQAEGAVRDQYRAAGSADW